MSSYLFIFMVSIGQRVIRRNLEMFDFDLFVLMGVQRQAIHIWRCNLHHMLHFLLFTMLIILSGRVHQILPALWLVAQTRNVLRYWKLHLVPLVVNAQFLSDLDLSRRKESYPVVSVALNFMHQVEWLEIWLATMIHEATLVAK